VLIDTPCHLAVLAPRVRGGIVLQAVVVYPGSVLAAAKDDAAADELRDGAGASETHVGALTNHANLRSENIILVQVF
jgi:hypothetical protein